MPVRGSAPAKGRLQAARELAHALALVGLLPDPGRVLLARIERQRAQRTIRDHGAALVEAA